MGFLRKPDNLYAKQLPNVNTTGEAKYDEDEEKLNKLQIIIRGMFGGEMEPKYRRRYEDFALNFKAAIFTLIICGGLFMGMIEAGFASEPYTGDRERTDTWFDKCIDATINFVEDGWEKVKNLF